MSLPNLPSESVKFVQIASERGYRNYGAELRYLRTNCGSNKFYRRMLTQTPSDNPDTLKKVDPALLALHLAQTDESFLLYQHDV